MKLLQLIISSTMVGENFEIPRYEMAKINHMSTMVGDILKYKGKIDYFFDHLWKKV